MSTDTTPSRPEDEADHLLVIDDDRRIRALLSRYLSEQGYRVTVAANAAEARKRLRGLSFDLLIVDVMMPGEDGLALTKSLRKDMAVPILILTAKGEAAARIIGLELGADDYIVKPFEPRELLLRINNILKRARPAGGPLIEHVRFGPFTFHLQRLELTRDNQPVRLTERERHILRAFATAPGQTVDRLALLGPDADSGDRTIDVQINRLRRKIEDDPANPLYLQTVRGHGYRLVTEA